MIQYILIIVSFIALAVGVYGKTSDDRKIGLKKLTIVGKIVIVIGFVTCSLGIVKNYSDQKKLDLQKKEAQRIKQIAYKDLNEAFEGVLWPIKYLYINTYNIVNDTNIIYFEIETDEQRFQEFLSNDFLGNLGSIGLLDSPTFPNYIYNDPWWKIIYESSVESQNDLKELWLKYHLYYDAEILVQLDSLKNDSFFNCILLSTNDLSKWNRNEPFTYIISDGLEGEWYQKFIKRMKRFKGIISKHINEIGSNSEL